MLKVFSFLTFSLSLFQAVLFSGFIFKINDEFFNVWSFKKLIDVSSTTEYNNAIISFFAALIFSVCFASTSTFCCFLNTGILNLSALKSLRLFLILNLICNLVVIIEFEKNLILFLDDAFEVKTWVLSRWLSPACLVLNTLLIIYLFYKNEDDFQISILKPQHFLINYLNCLIGVFIIFLPWSTEKSIIKYETLINLFVEANSDTRNGYIAIIILITLALILNIIQILYKTILGEKFKRDTVLYFSSASFLLYIIVFPVLQLKAKVFKTDQRNFSWGFGFLVAISVLNLIDFVSILFFFVPYNYEKLNSKSCCF